MRAAHGTTPNKAVPFRVTIREVNKIRTIGITGGVGCGKSEVLKYLEEKYDAYVVLSDDVARHLIDPDAPCFAAVLELFGPEYLLEDGSFDRKKIAAAVFRNEDLLEQLNGIIHPGVWEEVARLKKEKAAEGCPVLCVESALLVTPEGKKDNETFDELWYIYASEPVRRRRLKESRGYSDERISAMIGNQASEELFREACDVLIDNSGSMDDTRRQIDRLFGGI